MQGICVAHTGTLALGTVNPVNWTISTFYGAGGFGAYLTGAGTPNLTAFPTNTITLIRWSLLIQGGVPNSMEPVVTMRLVDSAAAYVLSVNEWASFDMAWGAQPDQLFVSVVGSIMIDSATLPGAGQPYTWRTDISGFASASTKSATLTLMSWSKP